MGAADRSRDEGIMYVEPLRRIELGVREARNFRESLEFQVVFIFGDRPSREPFDAKSNAAIE